MIQEQFIAARLAVAVVGDPAALLTCNVVPMLENIFVDLWIHAAEEAVVPVIVMLVTTVVLGWEAFGAMGLFVALPQITGVVRMLAVIAVLMAVMDAAAEHALMVAINAALIQEDIINVDRATNAAMEIVVVTLAIIVVALAAVIVVPVVIIFSPVAQMVAVVLEVVMLLASAV